MTLNHDSFFPKPDSPCVYLAGNNGPDGCAIFFKESKLDLLRKARRVLHVWEVPSNQVVLAMVFRIKYTGAEVCVATTHFKAKFGPLRASFRNEQSKDILKWLKIIQGGRPVIMGGDFNGEPWEDFYVTLTEDQHHPLVSAYQELPEFTSWKVREGGEEKHHLDYIFHSTSAKTVATLKVPSVEEMGDQRMPSLQFPSDHMSLVADIQIV